MPLEPKVTTATGTLNKTYKKASPDATAVKRRVLKPDPDAYLDSDTMRKFGMTPDESYGSGGEGVDRQLEAMIAARSKKKRGQ